MITAQEAVLRVVSRSPAIHAISDKIMIATEVSQSCIVYKGRLTEIEVTYLRSLGYKVWLATTLDPHWKIDFTGG